MHLSYRMQEFIEAAFFWQKLRFTDHIEDIVPLLQLFCFQQQHPKWTSRVLSFCQSTETLQMSHYHFQQVCNKTGSSGQNSEHVDCIFQNLSSNLFIHQESKTENFTHATFFSRPFDTVINIFIMSKNPEELAKCMGVLQQASTANMSAPASISLRAIDTLLYFAARKSAVQDLLSFI